MIPITPESITRRIMNESEPPAATNTTPIPGVVYLLGGGPGDPGLLTLRAKECLEQADFVLYDQLVSPRVLDFIPATAERVCVRDLPGDHPDRWPHIHRMLIDAARQGKVVARLKGGDPLIFGRGGEEAEALRESGIPYEIVPGVTAAFAAGSYLEIPLTHRNYASAVALVTGHENPMKSQARLDWHALSIFPGTLAIYMGIARLPLIIAELLKHGKDPQTPAIIVHKASTGEQLSVVGPLCDLDDLRRENGIETPALVLIGAAVGLKPERSWFERRPLLRQWVLVTRPAGQAAPMMRRLEQLGGVPYHLPTMTIREPEDWTEVDAALARLREDEYDWLVFTSVNGVHALFRRLKQINRDLRDLGRVRLAAIGPSTAAALREYHLNADVIPESYRAEELAGVLLNLVKGKRVLLARANRGRDLLPVQLGQVAQVTDLTVYLQHDGIDTKSDVYDHLRRGEINYITITSANIARMLLGSFDDTIKARIHRGHIRIASISPVTSEVIREMGFPVALEATRYTIDGIIDALVDYVQVQGDADERQTVMV